MSITAPAPSASRGEVILQPHYFTSSIYVKALRDDITTLILSYHEQYTATRPSHPFSLFKSLWSSQGWKWMHFMVYDDRTRETFLNVTLRLFLERMVKTEAPYTRAIALFGLYTFFYTQPLGAAPPLRNVTHIPIQLDQYMSLKTLPGSLIAEHLQPLQAVTSCILSTILKNNLFFITPRTEFGSLNPRDLPREMSSDEGTTSLVNPNAPKKRGRPTKREKAKKAKVALDNLDEWLQKPSNIPPLPSTSSNNPPTVTLEYYQSEKSHMFDAIEFRPEEVVEGRMAIRRANHFVLDRLKAADELVSTSAFTSSTGRDLNTGLLRVGRAVQELATEESTRGGVFGLVQGAGVSPNNTTCRE